MSLLNSLYAGIRSFVALKLPSIYRDSSYGISEDCPTRYSQHPPIVRDFEPRVVDPNRRITLSAPDVSGSVDEVIANIEMMRGESVASISEEQSEECPKNDGEFTELLS